MVVQYREAWFYLFEALRLAGEATGGGVVHSCDGTAVSASNLITDPATDVVQGTPASQVHSWAEIHVGDCWWLFEVNVAASLTTPRSARLYKATVAYNADGSTTTKPTTGASGHESASLSFNLMGFTTATAGSWFTWYSDGGSLFFGSKRDGDSFYTAFVFIPLFEDAPFGTTVTVADQTASNAVTGTALGSPTAGMASASTGVIASSTTLVRSPSISLTVWTNSGVDNDLNEVPHHPIWYGYNSNTSGYQRQLGYITDVRGVPDAAPWDSEDSAVPGTDPGTYRWRTVGALALPFPIGSPSQIAS